MITEEIDPNFNSLVFKFDSEDFIPALSDNCIVLNVFEIGSSFY